MGKVHIPIQSFMNNYTFRPRKNFLKLRYSPMLFLFALNLSCGYDQHALIYIYICVKFEWKICGHWLCYRLEPITRLASSLIRWDYIRYVCVLCTYIIIAFGAKRKKVWMVFKKVWEKKTWSSGMVRKKSIKESNFCGVMACCWYRSRRWPRTDIVSEEQVC